MESLYPILGYAGRAALGLGLSVAFGVGCILGGRGLYLFSGSYGWAVWLWVMLAAIALVAVAGAWAGYQWGSTQEIPCCVKPRTSSAGYAVFGAMVSANVASVALALFSRLRWKLPSPPFYGEGLGRSPATPAR